MAAALTRSADSPILTGTDALSSPIAAAAGDRVSCLTTIGLLAFSHIFCLYYFCTVSLTMMLLGLINKGPKV